MAKGSKVFLGGEVTSGAHSRDAFQEFAEDDPEPSEAWDVVEED